MKFSTALDLTQHENRFLRNTIHLLIIVLAVLTFTDLMLYEKNPVMVERTTHGLEIVRPADLMRQPNDIENGVKLMMAARFNSEANDPEIFINSKEMLIRLAEQKDMKSRGMSQSVLVRAVHVKKDVATVDLDRVIAIGDLRSALKTTVRITFEEITPNELNPYGLLLSSSEPVQAPTKEDKSR